MSMTITLIISFLTDFIISVGTTIAGAMLVNGDAVMPNKAVVILAIIMGTVTGARRAQALIEPSVVKGPPVLMPESVAIPVVKVPVTPQRVNPQPQPVQPKDSS